MLLYEVPFGKKTDSECNFKLMESTCHVHSRFRNIALGLANAVSYFNMGRNNNNSPT